MEACKSCWGMKAVEAGDHTNEVAEAHNSAVKPLMTKDGSITAIFKRVAKASFHTHTDSTLRLKPSESDYSLKIQIKLTCDRAKIMQWVAESVHPFEIVTNWGF